MNNSSGIQGKDLSLLNYSHEDSKLYNDLWGCFHISVPKETSELEFQKNHAFQGNNWIRSLLRHREFLWRFQTLISKDCFEYCTSQFYSPNRNERVQKVSDWSIAPCHLHQHAFNSTQERTALIRGKTGFRIATTSEEKLDPPSSHP
jgi:hypothetical protein